MNARTAISNALPIVVGCLLAPMALAQGQSSQGQTKGAATQAGAGKTAPAAAPAAPPPDVNAGKQLATGGNPTKGVTACVTCHGAQGEGNAAGGFPRLAGQSASYMAEQLAGYADGRRQNPIMAPIAKGLSENERQAVSAYYASLQAPATPSTQASPSGPSAQGPSAAGPGGQPLSADARRRAEMLLRWGDEKLQVQGCVNCHGPGGAGEPPAYPYLSGQHAGYLAATLREFKTDARKTDESGLMPTIAKKLSDSDIDALSAYLAQLPPPANLQDDTMQIRRQAAQGAMTPSGRQAGQSAPSGTGTEQGGPVTGGAQGPGGGGGGSGSGPSGSSTGR
ncbi:c-type cytochrome [Bordetella genomosp. 9]|uniref:c-type cytochrome n=1 Tax=Bordetella genomosp. 9 TaxID=1416803 RepID=UPI000A32563E|nr:c-type cytochrome [Bordetella genomosp. 9]